MKTGSFIALSLVGAAAAQPHGRKHNAYHKRNIVIDTDVVTMYQTAAVAVVVEDQYGDVLYTSQIPQSPAVQTVAVSTASPQVQAAVPTSYVLPTPKTSKHHKHTHKTKPKSPETTPSTSPVAYVAPTSTTPVETPTSISVYVAPTTATTSSSSSTPSGELSGYGISYSPYNSDGTCRSADDVKSDLANIKGFGYVRSYGVDCNQVPNLLQAAKAYDMKVMLGVYDIPSCTTELDTMIAAVEANGGWDLVHSVSIGNEDVNSGRATVAAVVAAVNSGRTQLRNAGFQGDVVHVDVFVAIINNPELCEVSDYVAANCHAFFDPNTAAANAGTFVQGQVDALKTACGGKEVHITESGWPHQGDDNGLAIPSPSNQQAALDSLKSKFSKNFVFFSAYNDLWKQDNAGTFGAEHYWGMFGDGTDVTGF